MSPEDRGAYLRKSKTQAEQSSAPQTPAPPRRPSFPIVGIGASAGGLEAFSQLLGEIPAKLGMAFVLIQHLDPTHPSSLVEALARKTPMPVHEIQDGMLVEPGNIYVIPPNAEVSLLQGAFAVTARKTRPGKMHLPIDVFFRALAAERRSQAIGVVLSGTASDGTEGLRAIKAEGGVTLVQEPTTAKFSGMPDSAISAGVVDVSLPIPDLAQELIRLARHPYMFGPVVEPPPQQGNEADFRRILVTLRDAVGVDFGEYKDSTIRRRLARRMAVRKSETLQDYAALLLENGEETQAFFDDLLIHVTSFFRDPKVFEVLKARVFPEILKHKHARDAIRMWVTGCSTGEEVYSLAICLSEFLGDARAKRPIQIFGTDLSEAAVGKARAGVYPESAVASLRPEQLQRFFTRAEEGYRISKFIRDLCVFVRHDLGRDPPFSKLDLISCRNLLIYFNPALQQRALDTFHYCLNTPGFLVLGHSENVPGREDLFSVVDKTNKIFARTAVTKKLRHSGRRKGSTTGAAGVTQLPAEPVVPVVDVSRQVDNLLLAQYAPPGVIVNERWEVLEFRGRTAPYLEPPPGQPQVSLLKMVREGLLSELRVALRHAKEEMTTIRREGVRVEAEGASRICSIVVVPLVAAPDRKERLFAVLFESVEVGPLAEALKTRRAGDEGHLTEARSDALEHELKATKEYLQSLIGEHQQANDALASTNEELVSSNEELQSMNEELETAKEELQSTNEELNTLNDEMHNRNVELNQVSNDVINLLNGVEIALVIVDAGLKIRRFTPKARSTLNLVPADVGRSIGDIRPNVNVAHLDQLITEVMETVTLKELEVQDREGRWYRMQIRPYKTVDNKIEGALLSVVDVDVLKRAREAAEWGREYAAGIVEAVQVPLLALDEKLVVQSANAAFYDVFGVSKAKTEGRSVFELGKGQWDVPDLRTRLAEVLPGHGQFQDLLVEREFPRIGKRTMSLAARPVRSGVGMAPRILLSIEDITDRERAERERDTLLHHAQAAEVEAEQATLAKDRFLAVLSHELRTPLSALLLQVTLLRRRIAEGAGVERTIDAIERAARIQARLTDDLLDVSRISSGKLDLAVERVDIRAVVREAIEMVRAMAEVKSVTLEEAVDESVGSVLGDPTRLRQVVWNLLTNAVKNTPAGGRITTGLDRANGRARIEVRDTGVGIEADFLPQIFDVFNQAGPTKSGGLGLGLAIVRHVVEQHHGTVQAMSPGAGQGATFTVTLPVLMDAGVQSEVDGLEGVSGSEAPREPVQPLDLSGLRVLVVEDDADTRAPLVEMLSTTGAEVRAATSAAEALQIFKEFRPQLLLSDIGMPTEDGHSLIRRIRELGPARGGDVRALALTAMASAKDRDQALAAGFNMHLAKPIGFAELAEALLTLLHRRRATERKGEA
ncbi:MAG TPA: chemotaxis protein CheB [Gemmatimonadales bacterium]|nr:chemotaxis protein CheB [Gemmatimonadales bacterium]